MSASEQPMKKTDATILIIDDQEDILFALKMLLKKSYERVFTLNNPKKVVHMLAENTIDVVLLDMNYRIGFEDGREGLYFLKEIKKLSPNTSIILMTAFGKVETAVEGLKLGAFDYILKPWDNTKLQDIIKDAVRESRKQKKLPKATTITPRYFIGESKEIQKAYTLAKKVAKTDANVLILGANGTGKMVMAQYIHEQSTRNTAPFVHVDLGSLNEHIFESELFGYAKGAFTDAKVDTPGRFEAAQGGTIFLDEIGNVPLHLQSKLLQVIQSKTVIRLGESKPRPVDVRIVSATNANLKLEVSSKQFRQDLYYRINTMEIQLPELKDRREDIIPLAEFLLENMRAKYEHPEAVFNNTAKEHMQNYSWNGNIREMQNRIERAIILCENNTITIDDLDLDDVPIEEAVLPQADLSEIEKIAIERALAKNDYNISRTAEELGLSRGALYRRIEKYGIEN